MSLLVAVKSCAQHRDAGFHDAIRATWGQDLKALGVRTMFFLGHSGGGYFQRHPTSNTAILKSDELEVDAPDDYHSLPHKTRAICQWAYGKAIDHLLLCDTDTYLKADKVLTCGYHQYDYTGKISRPIGQTFSYNAVDRDGVNQHIQDCHPWCSGGYGYFLSREALSLVSDTYPKSGTWAEDLWVGNALGKELARGTMRALDLAAGAYSEHFPSSKYKSGYNLSFDWMNEMHKANR